MGCRNGSSALSLLSLLLLFASAVSLANAKTHYHDFVIQETKVTKLCKTQTVMTVNGQLPGPTLEVNNGDSLVINVVNRAKENVTIHWHGVRQITTAWADGPEFITQCPIRPGGSYTYRFKISGQEVGVLKKLVARSSLETRSKKARRKLGSKLARFLTSQLGSARFVNEPSSSLVWLGS
ncbi:putative laccase [Helianthus annuus]|nr:putative laccase [Helianthus annuus]